MEKTHAGGDGLDKFEEMYGYTHDEILEHYGYKPDIVRTCGVGIWAKEDALQRLEYLPDFIKYVNAKEKARIEFNYDPDFPAAVLITKAALTV